MRWTFFDDGFNSGSYNMEFDLKLARTLEENEAALRLYRWKPYCISLGANQSEESLDLKKITEDRLDLVKRPSGGRAILHSEELTYSVAYHASELLNPKDLYKEINLALKKGLTLFDSILEELDLEHLQPHFPSFYKKDKSAVCFAVSSQNEINYKGKKLVGSAQRKIVNVILQHGSILCGDYHKRITDYLALPDDMLCEIRDEMDTTTTDLHEILGYEINITDLIANIKKGFELHFGIDFQNSQKEFKPEFSFN